MEKEIEIPADILSVMFQSEFVPVGSVQCFAMITPPQGYLVCDGSEYPCCVYPDLYKAIGNTFGGIENRTFCVPDLRGRFVRGWDHQACIDKKRDFGSMQEDAIKNHQHKINEESIAIDPHPKHRHQIDFRQVKVNGFSGGTSVTSEIGYFTGDYKTVKTYGSYDWDLKNEVDFSHQVKFSGNFVSDVYGESIQNETHPKNVALLYCIKAISLVGFASGASFKLTLNITEIGNVIKSDSSFSEKEKNDFYDLIKEECMREDISTIEDFLNAAGQYIHENSLLNRVFGVKDEPLDGSQTPFDKPIYFLVEFVRKNRNYKFLPEEDNTIREMVFKHVNNFVSR